ncbi:glycosyltransferase family 87 protein [Corynebacterium kutscheri]|uniref:Arabinofuranosyl transferase C n=1 Tax=Corynebacterium kutscheri TaxID=35755 RepID=A0A0F6TDY5_9CORY|nr:glycosyltransferase family 87 protein [Corynebacterium kutscheri]AKE41361.1 Protein of unknown function (DUF2029) [Corynebacterium kutscheri]VEH08637.1 arabinofuranosyl transferase C [Corynebacterium kutscheri]VEH09683.1 arabinofuranosyl transferase C [Corynebacterium kutscheri]
MTALFTASMRITTPLPIGGAHRTAQDRLLTIIFWPLALMLVAHRTIVLAINGDTTDDFSTVYNALRRFLEGVPVYNEVYLHVDPHYLYNPGATLLLSPMALFGHFFLARCLFIALNTAAIIAGLGLLTRLFGYSLKSAIFPIAITAAFLTEAVRNTLIFANINGVLFLALVAFMWLLLNERTWLAGIVIGLAILVKPMFLPLLFLPLIKWQWRTIVAAMTVVLGMNLAAWPLLVQPGDYFTKTTPYLGEIRDYSNSSLRGLSVYFGMPGWLTALWFFIFSVLILIGLIALLRIRYLDPLLWVTTTSSLLIVGVCFLSSLGQMYYSMMIFPLFFTILLRISAVHNPIAWFGAYFCLSPDDWESTRWLDYGRWIAFFQPTIGWGLIIIAIAISALMWWKNEPTTVEK